MKDRGGIKRRDKEKAEGVIKSGGGVGEVLGQAQGSLGTSSR